jgi:hypothetical protein
MSKKHELEEDEIPDEDQATAPRIPEHERHEEYMKRRMREEDNAKTE